MFFYFGAVGWGVGRHDDSLTGGDEVASEAFGSFLVADFYLVYRESFDFATRFFIEGFWAVADEIFTENRDGEI